VLKKKAYTKDYEPPTQMIRESIFQISLLPQGEIIRLFSKLDHGLTRQVAVLAREVPMVRQYFAEIIERIASGSTLGKNYYDKLDREDGKPKVKKTTILQPSEVRILKKAFWLLRSVDDPVVFSDLVLEIKFLRGVLEEAVEMFLRTCFEYEELIQNLADARKRHSIEYLKYEHQIALVHAQLGISNPKKIIQVIRSTKKAWDQYILHRDKILKPYLRMVFKWAKEFSSKGNEAQTLDNFQAGVFGLVRAVKNYTPDRFAHFSVVAENWVKQSILHYLKTEVNFIRLPMANWHYLQKIDKARQKIEQRQDKEATVEEIAKETDLAVTKVKKILENAQLVKVFSLNAPTMNEEDQESEGNWNLESIQAAETPETNILKASEIEIIHDVIQLFDDEEKTIFGLISGCNEVIPDPIFTEEELIRERIRQRAAQYNLEINFK
jgi:RNA polymerase sigma factor (sigma-70 family)